MLEKYTAITDECLHNKLLIRVKKRVASTLIIFFVFFLSELFFSCVTTAQPILEQVAGTCTQADVPTSLFKIYITGKNTGKSIFLPLLTRQLNKHYKNNSEYVFKLDDDRSEIPEFVPEGMTKTVIFPTVLKTNVFLSTTEFSIATVENLKIEDYEDSSKLFVSNSPELILQEGELLDGIMWKHDTIRYLIHHKNGTGKAISFTLSISNPDDEYVVIQSLAESVEKNTSEMQVGHKAAIEFLKRNSDGTGVILDIPPHETLVLNSVAMEPGEIVSGMGELRLLRGKRVKLSFKAQSKWNKTSAPVFNNENGITKRGHGAFGKPLVEMKDRFVIGGRWKFIGIGDKPLSDVSGSGNELLGNYGVTHKVEVTLENPFPQEENVDLLFSPVSGPAIGTMYVNNQLKMVGFCKPPETKTVETFTVAANSEKKVVVEITPESGAFYPVRLIFRSRVIN